MARAIKRKIMVLNKEYLWVLDSNSIDVPKERHIRIHSAKLTKNILYVDPYNWHFEIRPKTIEQVILFALELGWNPQESGKTWYISIKEDGEFYSLPEGQRFGFADR